MNAIILKGLAGQVEVPQTALEAKTRLLADAAQVTTVANSFDLDVAVEEVRKLKKALSSVEASRVEHKAPVLAMAKTIDDTAKTFVLEIAAESTRLSNLINAWNAEVARKAQEAERQRQAELQRIERERQAAEREAQQKAEAEARAAKTEQDRLAAQQRAEAEKVRLAEVAKVQSAAVAPVAVAQVKPPGTRQVIVYKHEVVDIKALYAARPDLVRIEVNVQAVTESIRSGESIPGLRIWKETRTEVLK